jgi:hypothetical protein
MLRVADNDAARRRVNNEISEPSGKRESQDYVADILNSSKPMASKVQKRGLKFYDITTKGAATIPENRGDE